MSRINQNLVIASLDISTINIYNDYEAYVWNRLYKIQLSPLFLKNEITFRTQYIGIKRVYYDIKRYILKHEQNIKYITAEKYFQK